MCWFNKSTEKQKINAVLKMNDSHYVMIKRVCNYHLVDIGEV